MSKSFIFDKILELITIINPTIMKKTFALLVIILFSAGFFHTQAQVGNYMLKKAKQAKGMAGQKADEEVTDEMNKEVDKGVEKVFDKFFGADETETKPENSTSKEGSDEYSDDNSSVEDDNSMPSKSSGSSSSDARANSMLKAMGVNIAPTNVNEVYNYSGNILMDVQSWEDNGKSEGQIKYKTLMTSDNSGFAMEFTEEGKEKSTMIFDYKNEKMIILSDDGETKSGMVTNYAGLAESMEEAAESEVSETNEETDFSTYREGLKKTGRSKNIAGYKCDEYIYEDEESIVEMWMTNQLPADLWANMFSANVMAAGSMGFYGGFVMEMDEKVKNSKERTYMLVKEVNKNQSSSLSTKGYQLMSIGVEIPKE